MLVVGWFKKYMDFHKWYHLIGGGRAEPGVGCQIMTPLTQKDMGHNGFPVYLKVSFECPRGPKTKKDNKKSFVEMVLYHVVLLAYTSITFKRALKGAQFFL